MCNKFGPTILVDDGKDCVKFSPRRGSLTLTILDDEGKSEAGLEIYGGDSPRLILKDKRGRTVWSAP